MKTRSLKLAIALLLVSATIACHKTGTKNMNNTDRQFLDQTAYAHNGAIEFGIMAMSRGENSLVTDYAQMEVSSHNADLDALHKLADARNYKIPSKMNVEHFGYKVSLETKSGRNFDSSYMNIIQEDHIEMVGIMQDEMANGNDEELKDYARNYINTADAHKKNADLVIGSMNIITR
ncbi:MAG: DUF4142 domain-containing protein [Taibaiella sp.]|nr:DUF4142 domain-containing protein [Taibaiella sp.]